MTIPPLKDHLDFGQTDTTGLHLRRRHGVDDPLKPPDVVRIRHVVVMVTLSVADVVITVVVITIVVTVMIVVIIVVSVVPLIRV